jgi:glycosyltransferase involved in cell wall biosynthesis
MKENNLVSVIITTKNEGHCLGDCLNSIRQQTYQNTEIIVVDNDSSDKTKEIARSFTDKVFDKGPERSAQRNLGLKKAQGNYLLYLDADMTLSGEVIKECVEKCWKENYSALYIPERIIGEGLWIRVRNFERSFYNATCIDAVRFTARDKALEIGGFDESLTGPEDWDFDRRIKEVGKSGIVESCLYHNEGDFNFRRYIQKKAYYAKSFQGYINKWGSNDPLIKKQLGLWYRLFGVFIERSKWKKLIKHPILALEMYFLRIYLGFNYLWKKQF